jgi:transcriptional regulator with XRE-family HTH domain
MLRLAKDLSQFQLAEFSGLSEGQISNIERGKSWTGELTFALLADALGVSQQSLVDFEENDAFIRNGGLRRRASRKPAKLIVHRSSKLRISVPKKSG